MEPREPPPPGDLWRFFTKASVLVFAIVVGAMAAVVVGGVIAWRAFKNEFPAVDPAPTSAGRWPSVRDFAESA